MAYDYHSPEVLKTSLPLVCDGEYHELDLERFVAVANEKTDAHIYINVESGYAVAEDMVTTSLSCPNCGSVFNSATKIPGVGRLRIRMVREAFGTEVEDPTYYYDLPLQRGMSWLDSRALFEMAEKGRGQHWEYKVTNASEVTLSTRFVKESTNLGQVDL
jgi:hypothetical protein